MPSQNTGKYHLHFTRKGLTLAQGHENAFNLNSELDISACLVESFLTELLMLALQAGREGGGLWLGEASSPWWSEPWVLFEVQRAGILMKELFKHSFLSLVSRILLTFKAKLYFMPLGSSNILPSCTGESGKQC